MPMGESCFALSRSGYFPRWISVTHPKTQTPYAALILGGFAGLGCVVLIDYSGSKGKLRDLLHMAVFGAVDLVHSRNGQLHQASN